MEASVCWIVCSSSVGRALGCFSVYSVFCLNDLKPTRHNLVWGLDNKLAANEYDFESVLLHELGHALGLDHPNPADRVGGGLTEYTQSEQGGNAQWDLASGTDQLPGSSDDVRDDDLNRHWFRKKDNNPFTLDSVVDSSTYSCNLADLPPSRFDGVNGTPIGTDSHYTFAVALGDVDRDGDLDVVAGNEIYRSYLYLNNGTEDPFVGVVGTPLGATARRQPVVFQ